VVNSRLAELTGVIEHNTVSEAMLAATEAAAASGGRVFPCIVFRQGERIMITTSFPYAFVRNHVRSDSAIKGESPRGKTNRPLLPDHVKSIQDYMLDNARHYIMPPVTLNVRKMPTVHVHRANTPTRTGHMIVDDTTEFFVTDGQHRIAAISGHNQSKRPVPGVIDMEEDFREHGIAVQIIYEPDLINIHQDFADAAQTKPIPASLLATYNMREPINRVLTRIVDESFLKDRVEETSKTLPKLSQYLFLLNQVRQFVKELLFRDYAMAEDMLERLAKERLRTEADVEAFVATTLQFLDVLAREMKPWNEIAQIRPHTDAATRIPDLRQQYVNLSASGLVLIGRAGHEIHKHTADPEERRRLYVRLAREIDWRRTGPLWAGTLLNAEGKIQTQRSPVKMAGNRVLEQLGLMPVIDEASDGE
jgi:DNA sulfur modification protein DndB